MPDLKKPELLVTAKNIEEIKQLVKAGADAIHIGSEKYGLRLAGDFSLAEIKEAIEIAHSYQVKVYIVMNAILHHNSFDELEEYIKSVVEYGADAIVFGDPAIYMTIKRIAADIPLHWNTETTSTNFQTVNFWAKKGIKRAVLARELSLEEVIRIKNKTNIEIQAQIHGLTCIFHSKRSLVTDYLDHRNKDAQHVSKEKEMFLKEHKRPDEKYPIFEDMHGTHIMSNHDICMIDHLDKFLTAGIDSLKIDGLLYSTEYLIELVKLYRLGIDMAAKHQELSHLLPQVEKLQHHRPLTTGFYFKEQIY